MRRLGRRRYGFSVLQCGEPPEKGEESQTGGERDAADRSVCARPRAVSGRPLDRFAKEALFDPLGITDWEWVRLADGNPSAAGGLRLRPRDLAKIGQLVLNRGVRHGRQIVSTAWIKQMTTPHSPPGRLSGIADSYGYLWWLGHHSRDNRDIAWIGGLGYGGQRLYIVPSLDLVVAVTAGDYRRGGMQDIVGYTALGMALHAARPH